MNKQVSVQSQNTLPGLLPDLEVLRLAESFRPHLDHMTMVVTRLPTLLERQTMQTRSNAIGVALEPIGKITGRLDRAAEAIAGLLVAYGYGRNDKNPDETVTVYLKHLDMMPVFSIEAACADVLAGRVYDIDKRTGNHIPLSKDKEPSTIRLRSVAQKHVDVLAAEKWKFDKVLMAKRAIDSGPSDADRKIIGKGFDDLKVMLERNIAKNSAEDQARKIAQAERAIQGNERTILDQYAALGLEPIRNNGLLVSPSLAKKIGGLHLTQRTDAADRRDYGDQD